MSYTKCPSAVKLVLATTLMLLPCSAEAAVDLTGTFFQEVNIFIPETCTLTIVQTGTSIELEQTCALATDGVGTGTIDPDTGVFSATGDCGHSPTLDSAWSIEGTASPDGSTVSGTFTCIGFVLIDIPYSATRCGNGVLDPGEECDDGNQEDGDDCSSTCKVSGCDLEPDCRGAEKSLLLLKDDPDDDSKDKLIWKWIKGEETTQSDFGMPTATAAYTLCVYSGSAEAVIARARVSSDATKWKPIGEKGWKYKDKPAVEDGVQKVLLKGGGPAKAKVIVKGKGANLPDLAPLTLPLGAEDFPVTVQLSSSETELCWESVFHADDEKKNDGKALKLKDGP